MRIHHTLSLPRDYVVVVENAVVVAQGRLKDLLFEDEGDDDHEFIEVFLHPDSVPAFKERFFPQMVGVVGVNRRLN